MAAKPAASETTQLARLGAEFTPDEHKSRTQGGQELTYVAIDATLNRLNEVLGSEWSTDGSTTLTAGADGRFTAFTELYLRAVIDGKQKTAYGVGAMVNKDPDMAAKTALAEAIKKAGHQLGIALYLWDADRRDGVKRKQQIANGTDAFLKTETFRIARKALGQDKPSAADVAKHFGVKPAEMSDPAVLRRILEAQEDE